MFARIIPQYAYRLGASFSSLAATALVKFSRRNMETSLDTGQQILQDRQKRKAFRFTFEFKFKVTRTVMKVIETDEHLIKPAYFQIYGDSLFLAIYFYKRLLASYVPDAQAVLIILIALLSTQFLVFQLNYQNQPKKRVKKS